MGYRMRTTSLLRSTALLFAACAGLAALQEGVTGAAGAAPPATGPKPAGPTKLTVDFIADKDKASGKLVLLVLPEEGAAFTEFCRALAPKDSTPVYVRFEGQDTASAMAGAVAMSLRKGRAEGRFFDPNRVVVIAGPKGIGAALELLDRFGDRIDGAILISAAPVQRTDEAIQVWKPSKEAWKVPIWVTVGSSVKDAAQTLLMWRQVAAGAPKDACLTIDVRLDEAAGYVNPDSFGFGYSIQLVVMVVIGGMASIWGAILGAGSVSLLAEYLRARQELSPMIFGCVLVAVMVFMPDGLWAGSSDFVSRLLGRKAQAEHS